jgi:hypothetical protein
VDHRIRIRAHLSLLDKYRHRGLSYNHGLFHCILEVSQRLLAVLYLYLDLLPLLSLEALDLQLQFELDY